MLVLVSIMLLPRGFPFLGFMSTTTRISDLCGLFVSRVVAHLVESISAPHTAPLSCVRSTNAKTSDRA